MDYAATGEHGLSLAMTHHFDVILLDLNLPDIDGLEVCERIKSRQTRVTPILMLTARDAFNDKAKGFMRGTDDYLTKPFIPGAASNLSSKLSSKAQQQGKACVE